MALHNYIINERVCHSSEQLEHEVTREFNNLGESKLSPSFTIFARL